MLNSSMFSWNKDTDTFVAEASDLEMKDVPTNFKMQSARTGNVVTFERYRIQTDAEGEVLGWEFWCDEPFVKCVIIND